MIKACKSRTVRKLKLHISIICFTSLSRGCHTTQSHEFQPDLRRNSLRNPYSFKIKPLSHHIQIL